MFTITIIYVNCSTVMVLLYLFTVLSIITIMVRSTVLLEFLFVLILQTVATFNW